MSNAAPDAAVPPDASPFRSARQREADRVTKREAVLLASVRVFNERGFAASSLDDVAAVLGVTKTVVYRYLGNKEQVLLECVSHGMAQLQDAADTVRRQPGRGGDRLVAFLRRYAEINMTDFGRCVIRTSDTDLSPDGAVAFRARKRGIDAVLRELIEGAVADGAIVADDVRLTAFVLAGALNWPANWYRPEGRIKPAAMARRLVDILMAGLRPA